MKIEVGRENSTTIHVNVDDLGFGRPVLLLHGWPGSSLVWEPQVQALLRAGLRTICVDRRGFGRSSRCTTGFDLDTLADDIDKVVRELDLRDCSMVSFGMGSGELLRYVGNHGGDRVRSVAFVTPLPPFPQESGEHRPFVKWRELQDDLERDRYEAVELLIRDAHLPYTSKQGCQPSDSTLRALTSDAFAAGHTATLASVALWDADFRDDLQRVGMPALVVQGAADNVFPASCCGEALARELPDARLLVIEGAPHGLLRTHAAEVNAALLSLLA